MAVAGYNSVAPSPCEGGAVSATQQEMSASVSAAPANTQVVIHGEQIYILIFSSQPILVWLYV